MQLRPQFQHHLAQLSWPARARPHRVLASPGGFSRLAATLFVFLTMVATAAVPTNCAVASEAAPKTKARQAILLDVASGAVMFERDADERAPPASMSKLMTLAVVFRALKTGQLKLDDEFTMSENAWRNGGAPSGTSAMMVPINTREKLSELLLGIIVQSGNDAAMAVAEGIAGSEGAFAEMMNAEAKRIGLTSSTFRNATGLFHPEHLMTARDLGRLAVYLITTYPEYYPMFAEKEFKYRRHKFANRNPLVFLDIGVDGLKTGHLKVSGHGLVASARQGDRRLVLVVNGLETANDRREEGRRLLEWGFRGFNTFKLFDADEVIGQARVWGGEKLYVPLVGKGDVTVVLPRFPPNQRLRAEIFYKGPLKPPLKKGEEVAKLRVSSTGGATNEVPLYAAEAVERAGVVRRGLDSLAHLATSWIP